MQPGELLRSSTFRLVLSYMALFAGSVLLLLGFIYWSTIAFMAKQTDVSIKTEISWLTGLYNDHGINALISTINERSARYRSDRSFYSVSSSDFRLLAGNVPVRFDVNVGKKGWKNIEVRGPRPGGRVIQIRARSVTLPGGEYLLVGRDTREMVVSQKLIVPALLWGLVIMLVLAILGGVLMSRSVLRHIESINKTVREIMAGDLSRRIPTRNSNDDFDQLARNLNTMLDEISRLMDGIRQVSSNVAHDLRTPLTRLRNNLEGLRTVLGKDSAHLSYVDESVRNADQLLNTFSALLRIARIEAGGQKACFQLVDTGILMSDVKELYEALSEDKGIALSLDVSGAGRVLVDRDLLFQAVANLLDNAIKYSHQGGSIALSVECDDYIDLTIKDNGPGIPASEQENVLTRFYRLESSRTSDGNGLGLSLVAAVVKMHNGELLLSDNSPGLVATIRLKLPHLH